MLGTVDFAEMRPDDGGYFARCTASMGGNAA